MALGLGVGDVDQIVVAETARLRQDWRRHGYIVIPGELPHHFEWCVIHRCETLAELGERATLDPLDQVVQDVVEHVDLLIVETIGVGDEKVGDAPQSVDAFVLGAAFDSALQFGDKRLVLEHVTAARRGTLHNR